MARLTLEELQKDPLLLLDFEHLKSMGVNADDVWDSFAEYQISAMMNILTAKSKVCFQCTYQVTSPATTNLIQKQLKKYSVNERYVLYMLSCCYACPCCCC